MLSVYCFRRFPAVCYPTVEDIRKALGESYIEIADTDEGREIISVFSQVGYTWGQDSDYDVERAAQELLNSLEA